MKRKLVQAGLNSRARKAGEANDSDSDGDIVKHNGPLAPSKKFAKSEKDVEILAQRKMMEEEKANIVPYTNKQRVLIFCSRGVTARYRHLMEDLRILLPHNKKEVKHDTKKKLFEINEIAEMKNCNNVIFFEVRKRKDLYMWLTKAPNGPSVKFHVVNIHTMDELRLTGNCLKGSRPFLNFDAKFDNAPHLALCKEVLTQAFGTPNGHPRSKPFHDHVFNFSVIDGRIWFRNFQITDTTTDPVELKKAMKEGKETVNLVEVGPRFVLNIIKIFDGGFGGQPLYENPAFVSPNTIRHEENRAKGERYENRKLAEEVRVEKLQEETMPADPLGDVFK